MARRIRNRPHKEPLVSVITPVFNRPMGVVECTQGLITQTYKNWEHVIIDDASTDETQSLLESSTDFRVRSFRNEKNIGAAASYARGFKEARGEYVVMNDSDDVSFPNRLERVVKKFQETNADVVYHGLLQSISHQEYGFPVYAYKGAPEFSIQRIKKEQYIPGVLSIKREIATKFIPDEKYWGCWDWQFIIQLVEAGAVFQNIDEALYLYRRHAQSLSVQNEETGRRKESLNHVRRYIRQAKGLG